MDADPEVGVLKQGGKDPTRETAMNIIKQSSKEDVRAWLKQRAAPRTPPPNAREVRRSLEWKLVQDDTALNPRSSYGMQKAIGELLVNDYSRRGFVDGRVLRLPTISVRPGKPNKAASSFASSLIREPLNGEETVCPVQLPTRVWLLSPRKAIDCLIKGHELPAEVLGDSRIVNLPGISVSVAEMIGALERAGGADALKRIRWGRDAAVERIVDSWPGAP